MLYSRHVVDPKIVPRAEHGISRNQIDADALRVMYRLHQSGYRAYLVGGGVRDLLLGRRPKDFDIGTDAHPYQIKKLFRNCWIIGRRFRLAHVRFGPTKVVEVATFRRLIVPGTETEPAVVDTPTDAPLALATDGQPSVNLGEGITLTTDTSSDVQPPSSPAARIVHDDNTFGTPEEDAFRRDFTINALFYDIGTLSIIDYTGGIDDLRAGIVRCIGDPNERFQEDPVRMMRALVFAARLVEALERLDAYRTLTAEVPPNLSNPVLLATLLVPLGMLTPRSRRGHDEDEFAAARGPALGRLPLARKDIERIGHMLTMQSRLAEMEMHPRRQRGMAMRPSFTDALTWMDIHGDAPDVVDHWQQGIIDMPPDEERSSHDRAPAGPGAPVAERHDGRQPRRRRRGRRR